MKNKKETLEEEFDKKLRRLLDEAHLLGKQGWEGDKVDNLEIEELKQFISTFFEEQKKEMIKKVNDILFLNTKLGEKKIDDIILKLL